MTADQFDDNRLQPVDAVIEQLAEYVMSDLQPSDEAITTARLCMMDALACGMLALQDANCPRVLGPVVDEAEMPNANVKNVGIHPP